MSNVSGTGGGQPHRSRAPVVSRSDLVAADVGFYDRIIATRPAVEGPFAVLIHSPDLAARIADVGSFVRFESEIPIEYRCMSALIVASHFDCRFMFAGWAPQAEAAGLDGAFIEAIRNGTVPPFTSEGQRSVWEFGTALVAGDHRVGDAGFSAVVELLGVKGAVELAATLGYFSMLTFVLNGFEVPPEP